MYFIAPPTFSLSAGRSEDRFYVAQFVTLRPSEYRRARDFHQSFSCAERETCVHSHLPAAFFGVAGNFHLRAAGEPTFPLARGKNPADKGQSKERWARTTITPTQRRQFC